VLPPVAPVIIGRLPTVCYGPLTSKRRITKPYKQAAFCFVSNVLRRFRAAAQYAEAALFASQGACREPAPETLPGGMRQRDNRLARPSQKFASPGQD
jgi:hypothetical protein